MDVFTKSEKTKTLGTGEVLTTIAGIRAFLEPYRNRTIALVPTMGALHAGHAGLIDRAVGEAAITVVSIFINPLQFGPGEDLDRYPRDPEADRELCALHGAGVIFAPTPETLGLNREGLTTVHPPKSMTEVLCGAYRPGHFEGVATIVSHLFNIVKPNIAYFGEKDGQQLAIIRRMTRDLHFDIEIRSCPTVRESSGLALSSRNRYLSGEEKRKATVIYRSLNFARGLFRDGERDTGVLIEGVKGILAGEKDFRPQYVEIVDRSTLAPLKRVESSALLAIAGHLGETRLIDNIPLNDRSPIIAIDGPAGAGKSTVTRGVAGKLNLTYLDTGAMYRAVTWLVVNTEIPLENEPAIAELINRSSIELSPAGVKVNGEDVTEAIRSPLVSSLVSPVAALKSVRRHLVALQRRIGERGGIVIEGRDIGTNVFPDADLKIFLTASPAERAKRRFRELQEKGITDLTLEAIEENIQQRDTIDSNRAVSPLRKAIDAIEIDTDNLTVGEAIDKIASLYRGLTG